LIKLNKKSSIFNKYKLAVLIILYTLEKYEYSNLIQKKYFQESQDFISNNKKDIFNKSLIKNDITDKKSLIIKLNSIKNHSKYNKIIFSDYYISKVCYDKSAYSLFQYYLKNSIDIPYYIINSQSDFYKSLLKINKTKNLILYNNTDSAEFYQTLFNYLKDTKIIVNAYSIPLLQYVAANVSYIKYLKINHGIKYFKIPYAKSEFIKELREKGNVICSSPYEYEIYTKIIKYKPEQIHNASLARYERFNNIKKNSYEKKCILISFTYRIYNKYIFEKSEYKSNLNKFLNNKELITFLIDKKIELIYIPHHKEIELEKKYYQDIYKYCKILNQSDLEHYIEQCSLLVTDFSSLSFDFMFQNKPVLYYSIDKNDTNTVIEKNFMRSPNDIIYFGNYFSSQNLLIDKIKYYINNSFNIGDELRSKYESVFLCKKNIHKKLSEIIDRLIEKR